MIDLQNSLASLVDEISCHAFPPSIYPTFYQIGDRLKNWVARFPYSSDDSIFRDLHLLHLNASKKFLDHRTAAHLFRLLLSIYVIQKKIIHFSACFPQQRHLSIRTICTDLIFPFTRKTVLGCQVGFNTLGRYEEFDKDNVALALEKYLPGFKMVDESFYCHATQNSLKLFYFEIESINQKTFSISDRFLIKNILEDKIKRSIQQLSPKVSIERNDEEVFKNIFVLSQEIQSLQDPPQVSITFNQYTESEIIFHAILVHSSPFHHFSLERYFPKGCFFQQDSVTVKHIDNHAIKAYTFYIHLPREASLLRADGALNFYAARQRVVSIIRSAVGEFRDYNGGILIKQQELLQSFKERFASDIQIEEELIEEFFYAITPIEKQIVLSLNVLSRLFTIFLENRKVQLSKERPYFLSVQAHGHAVFLLVAANDPTLTQALSREMIASNVVYNVVDTTEGLFLNSVLLQTDLKSAEPFIETIKELMHKWHQKIKSQQILRIGLENAVTSLDPRIGGETFSADILTYLFEGLMRFNGEGTVENGIAGSVDVSSDLREYTFKLRPTLWNDGSTLSAYDFEYAWKKVLSPSFNTSFAYLFYPIKNAREAKKGTVSLDDVGIKVIDERTLKVELTYPTSYFLQLIAHPLYSPIHRLIDQQRPQWCYQTEKNYPCNGPFQLKTNSTSQGYRLIRNPYYWDIYNETASEIVLTPLTLAQAVQAFKKNEIDWIGNPFSSWHPLYNSLTDYKKVSFHDAWVCWCVFNTSAFPFNHRKLRQAFSYAIQRAQITANDTYSLIPAFSPLIPFEKNPRLHAPFPDYDKEKAKQLFKEALQELSLEKEALSNLTLIFADKGTREIAACSLKEQFKECFGIETSLKPSSSSHLFQKMKSGNFQMGLIQWTSWIDDPIYNLNTFRFADDEINFSRWESVDYQKLLVLSDEELNPYRRSLHLLKAEELLSQEVPIVPLFYQYKLALTQPNMAFDSIVRRSKHITMKKIWSYL